MYTISRARSAQHVQHRRFIATTERQRDLSNIDCFEGILDRKEDETMFQEILHFRYVTRIILTKNIEGGSTSIIGSMIRFWSCGRCLRVSTRDAGDLGAIMSERTLSPLIARLFHASPSGLLSSRVCVYTASGLDVTNLCKLTRQSVPVSFTKSRSGSATQ